MKNKSVLILLIIAFLCFPQGGAFSQDFPVVLGKDHPLHDSFLDFAFSRVNIINQNFIHSPDNIFIDSAGPVILSRYHTVYRTSISIEVKKVNSGLNPYIGVLQYVEIVYESNGTCTTSVADCRFNPVINRKVTEIFRFVQDRWQ